MKMPGAAPGPEAMPDTGRDGSQMTREQLSRKGPGGGGDGRLGDWQARKHTGFWGALNTEHPASHLLYLVLVQPHL